MEKTCLQCGGQYNAPNSKRKYCSHDCASKAWVKSEGRNCETCGKPFTATRYNLSIGAGRFCSNKCAQIARTTNITFECKHCGEPFHVYPSHVHKRIYCSVHCRAQAHRKIYVGENATNWQGGKVPEGQRIRKGSDYKDWREAVYARDNWTCQECGDRGVYLHAHHIFQFADYPEHRFEIWNGITLCRECHYTYHWKGYRVAA